MVMKQEAQFFGLSTVPALIIVLIAGMLIVFIGYKLTIMSKDLSDVERCRLSVVAKAKTKVVGMESPVIQNIDCYTRWVSAKDDGIYKRIRGQDEKRVFSFGNDEKQNLYQVKKIIADEMHDCWYQMGEGKISPWGTAHLHPLGHCIICTQVTFEKKFGEIDINEFLLEEKIPVKNVAYATYFGYDKEDLTSTETKMINTEKPINVVYIISPPGFGGIMGTTLRHKSLIDINVPIEIEGEDKRIHMGLFYNEDIVEECTQLY